MNKPSDKQTNPSNDPTGGSITREQVDSMSAVELADALENALESMTEDDYDEALIGAYLDALDRKAPIADMPDMETAFSDFQMRRRRIAGPDEPITVSKRPVRFGKLIRLGLAAALAVIAILGTMAVAQAAGVDIWGAVARWTDGIFSFGEIRSDGARDVPKVNVGDGEAGFASLQEALDAYGITEVSEPAWFPEGYTFRRVTVDCWSEGDIISLTAEYLNETSPLLIGVKCHLDSSSMYFEKTSSQVETFLVNETTAYLLENINNNTVVWVTEHYECYIGGAVEKSELRQMVLSTNTNS